MSVPTPIELVETHGRQFPEELATTLGFAVERQEQSPVLPGVTVLSEYKPEGRILLFLPALRKLAERRAQPLTQVEQWHIAHELYHGLAESTAPASWRVRETEADLWADELLTLVTVSPLS